MQRICVTGLMLVLFLIAACGAPAVTPATPPEIVYGEDVCNHCGMIINDDRFAAAVVIETQPNRYEHRIFDDIGDMFAFARDLAANDDAKIVSYFVHDYASREWLHAADAHFVKADPALTPMGSGLAAFANKEEANAQAQLWHGTLLTFDDARHQAVADHSHAAHE